jgi:hypothetical protein
MLLASAGFSWLLAQHPTEKTFQEPPLDQFTN